MKAPTKRPRGRPLRPDANHKAVMGFQATPDLRRRIVAAAQASGRNLTGEMVWRLEMSFIGEPLGRLEKLVRVLTKATAAR